MDYNKLFDDFITKYTAGHATGEEVGFIVAQLAQAFSGVNTIAGRCELVYKKKLAAIANGVDLNGKAVSMAKAEIDGEATDEYGAYATAKRDLVSVETLLNGAKSLQKGVLNEYAHMGN